MSELEVGSLALKAPNGPYARRHVYMVMELRITAKMSLDIKEVKQPRLQRQRERDK